MQITYTCIRIYPIVQHALYHYWSCVFICTIHMQALFFTHTFEYRKTESIGPLFKFYVKKKKLNKWFYHFERCLFYAPWSYKYPLRKNPIFDLTMICSGKIGWTNSPRDSYYKTWIFYAKYEENRGSRSRWIKIYNF